MYPLIRDPPFSPSQKLMALPNDNKAKLNLMISSLPFATTSSLTIRWA